MRPDLFTPEVAPRAKTTVLAHNGLHGKIATTRIMVQAALKRGERVVVLTMCGPVDGACWLEKV